jgi:hypothetical protein
MFGNHSSPEDAITAAQKTRTVKVFILVDVIEYRPLKYVFYCFDDI